MVKGGIAAELLVTQAGMTRRECAPWLGVSFGSAVGYQIKHAEVLRKSDARLAKSVARLESRYKADQRSYCLFVGLIPRLPDMAWPVRGPPAGSPVPESPDAGD